MSKRLSSLFVALIIFLSCVLVAFTGISFKQLTTSAAYSGSYDTSGASVTSVSASDISADNYL
jgi:hypothetical protein